MTDDKLITADDQVRSYHLSGLIRKGWMTSWSGTTTKQTGWYFNCESDTTEDLFINEAELIMFIHQFKDKVNHPILKQIIELCELFKLNFDIEELEKF